MALLICFWKWFTVWGRDHVAGFIQGIAADIGAVHGKERLLIDIATAALEHPGGRIEDVIFPIAGAGKLRAVIDEHRAKGTLDTRIQQTMRASYASHYRRMLPPLLDALRFRSNNAMWHPILTVLDLIVRWAAAGRDVIFGGAGADFLNGGVGADRFFHLGTAGHGSDWIQDFTPAQGDMLVFGGAAAASDFQINLGHTADSSGERAGDDTAMEAFVIYRPTEQILWALVDGQGQDELHVQTNTGTFDLLA